MQSQRKRAYREDRVPAPSLKTIIRQRIRGVPIAGIARNRGCHRRTVYARLDLLASRGELPPLLVPVLFSGHRPSATTRMFRLIAQARKEGIPIRGWDEARSVLKEDLRPDSPDVQAAVKAELAR
jgi:DNA invertase Pin-like site-specific DNA recombinase